MRKRWFVLVGVLLVAAYWAWPYVGAYGLATAAAQGNTQGVAARVDFPAVRHGLAKQVIRAYLRDSGRGDKLGAFGRGVAIAVGTSVADPYLSALISPESLTALLGQGRLEPLAVDGRTVVFDRTLPRLTELLGDRLLPVVLGSFFDGPTSFLFNLDAPGGDTYGVRFQLTGTTWRLSGIELPAPVVDKIASDIVAKERANKQS